MINPEVQKGYGRYYKGVLHMPVNVCSWCGETDEPGNWPHDDDDDPICNKCEQKRIAAGGEVDD